MGLWLTILAESLLIPVLMIGIGWFFLKRPPKKINPLFGYRTTMSMKNQDTWEFAHQVCGKVWFRWGWVLLMVSAVAVVVMLGMRPEQAVWMGTYLCLLQLIPLLVSIVPVERALKKTFDKDGNRKKEEP